MALQKWFFERISEDEVVKSEWGDWLDAPKGFKESMRGMLRVVQAQYEKYQAVGSIEMGFVFHTVPAESQDDLENLIFETTQSHFNFLDEKYWFSKESSQIFSDPTIRVVYLDKQINNTREMLRNDYQNLVFDKFYLAIFHNHPSGTTPGFIDLKSFLTYDDPDERIKLRVSLLDSGDILYGYMKHEESHEMNFDRDKFRDDMIVCLEKTLPLLVKVITSAYQNADKLPSDSRNKYLTKFLYTYFDNFWRGIFSHCPSIPLFRFRISKNELCTTNA